MTLSKSVKSLQLRLNEYLMNDLLETTVTASAYSQARQKLRYTAYTDLNTKIVHAYYEDNHNIKTFMGYRCIAGDGSKIILPNNKSIKKQFGSSKIKNSSEKELGTYNSALVMCHYDVLNNIAIDTSFNHCKEYEVTAALKAIHRFNSKDLLIYDRGFASYQMLAALIKNNNNFLIRFPSSSFKAVNEMFTTDAPWSKEVELQAPRHQLPLIRKLKLPEKIIVRFVKVVLSTGEIEVLATSLFDKNLTEKNFKELYNLRWGVETFFSKIKGRLNLENFTGKSVESVLQDFWSTIFICNLETIYTEDIDQRLKIKSKKLKYSQSVNKAVSFNVIKNMAFELFLNNSNDDDTIEKLELLFLTNPICNRPERERIRQKSGMRSSLNYQKRARKHVY